MKERLVICNEEDTDGRARVTRDEEGYFAADFRRQRLYPSAKESNVNSSVL